MRVMSFFLNFILRCKKTVENVTKEYDNNLGKTYFLKTETIESPNRIVPRNRAILSTIENMFKNK